MIACESKERYLVRRPRIQTGDCQNKRTGSERAMQIGMIGLGRMGGNMAKRLLRAGHQVVAYDRNEAAAREVMEEGGASAASVQDLAGQLRKPRAAWLMLPAGEITESTFRELLSLFEAGDSIVDGGNANYKDSIRRAETAKESGIHFLDAGTSGGVWGLQEGYSMMVGGEPQAYDRLRTVFESLAPAPDRGVGRVGPPGAGHFVKMVHNGIEYGMMQAIAEGFEIMEGKPELVESLGEVAEIWRHGSVVRSWLMDLAAAALDEDARLEQLDSYVEDSGEGRWTVLESIDLSVPAPVITSALQARFRSRQENPFGGRMLAALRKQFGGHAVRTREDA
ncbi:MAG: phosphogluconate dehydrogenase (NAD(+)-dependent, decarboxylating) [Chloroflexota bacterium]